MADEEKRAFAARVVHALVDRSRRAVALLLGAFLLVSSLHAHAQCPHCNPASAHSPEMCRIGNPPQEFYRGGQGDLSVGSMLAQACSLYAAEHSSQAYAAVWQGCTPRIPAPGPQNFGNTWASFSVDGTLLLIERSTGKVVSTASGGWSLATCSCWDSVKPYSASMGNTGQCYCKGEEVWDAARQTCVPRPAEPLRIELEGDTVTRAAPLGPPLAQRAVVRRAGAPVAGAAVSIAIQGQGTLQGTTDGAGQFHFTYVPPRGKARDTVTGNCTGCENTAMRPIEVTAPGVEMCPAEAGTLVGNPILAATGEKVHFEQDFADGAAHPLHFGRSYRSQGGWRHTWEGRIGLGSEARVVELGDGSIAVFTLRAGRWVSDNGDTLAPHAAGLTYRKAREDRRWEFDAGGRLVALVQANGWAMSLAYDAAGRLQRVTNAFGRSLVFTHGEGGKVQSVQVPGGAAHPLRVGGGEPAGRDPRGQHHAQLPLRGRAACERAHRHYGRGGAAHRYLWL